jgi:uncharacterized protein (TIGR03437 family)
LQSNHYGGGFPESFFAMIGSPSIAQVANAFGGSSTIAPNTWIKVLGSSFSTSAETRIWQASDFVNNQMPTQLDGVGVTMNGAPAYIYYISPTQVNALTPPNLAPGPVQVEVVSGGVVSASFTAQAQALSPSLFVFDGTHVVATHLNGTDVGPTTLYPGLTTPAQPGELVVLYANGFGPTSIPVVAGSSVQSWTLSVLPVIQIGGVTAAVQYAGLQSPGTYQINVYVPSSTPNGDNPITVQYNGLSTPPGTVITVLQQ